MLGNEAATTLLSAKMVDDVSSVSKSMAANLRDLHTGVKSIGSTFKSFQGGNLVVTLKESRKLFSEAGGNAKLFSAALKVAGTSALDARLLLNKMNAELTVMHRNALGLNGLWNQVFNIHPATLEKLKIAQGIAGGVAKTIAGIATGGLAAGAMVGAGAYKVGSSVVGAASRREDVISSMAYQYEKPGTDRKAAEGMASTDYRWAQRLAKDSPLDTPQVTRALNQFTTQGFDRRQAKILTTLAADQQSKHMDQPEVMQNMINWATRARGQGTSAHDLTFLRESGIQSEGFNAELRKLPEMQKFYSGLKKDASQTDVAHATKKALSSGMVPWQSEVQAAINSQEADKPGVGELAKRMGMESLSGSISNAENAWDDLLQSVNSAKWPGIVEFRNLLNRFSSALDSDTESGKKLNDKIKEITDSLMVGMKNITSEDIEKFLDKALTAAQGFAEWLSKGYDIFAKFLHSEGSLTDSIGEALMDVGVWIGQGIKKAMLSTDTAIANERFEKKHGGLTQAELGYQADSTGKSKDALLAQYDAHLQAFQTAGGKVQVEREGTEGRDTFGQVMAQPLPSAAYDVFRDLGFAMADGAADAAKKSGLTWDMLSNVPRMAAGGVVSQPTLAIIGEAGPEAVVPLGRGRGGAGWSGDLNLSVNGSGLSAQEVGAVVSPMIVQAVNSMFNRAAYEG